MQGTFVEHVHAVGCRIEVTPFPATHKPEMPHVGPGLLYLSQQAAYSYTLRAYLFDLASSSS